MFVWVEVSWCRVVLCLFSFFRYCVIVCVIVKKCILIIVMDSGIRELMIEVLMIS